VVSRRATAGARAFTTAARLWHDQGVPPPPPRYDERRARASARRSRHGATAPPPPEVEPEEPAELAGAEFVPVRRLLSLAIAGFAGLLGVGLVFGAQTTGVGPARAPYGVVVFGVQALFVISWVVATRPPGPRVVGTVGLATAALADVAAIAPTRASVALLGYVTVAGFAAGVVGQLIRRSSRVRSTESLGATLLVVVGVVSFATLIVLTRLNAGTQAIVAGLSAAALSLMTARVVDVVAPYPRLAPQVPRGASGVVLGAMLGSVAGAVMGGYLDGLDPKKGALVGFVTALSAVLADLSVGYAEASRDLAGEPGSLWLARHLQGPLAGFALAAPALYVVSVLFLVPRL
jgi:hypothetical protein